MRTLTDIDVARYNLTVGQVGYHSLYVLYDTTEVLY